jgi:hypothetical protein
MRMTGRPCSNVCTMCTPPLAGQTRNERTLPGSQKAAIRRRSRRKFVLVMSSPQLLAMNE